MKGLIFCLYIGAIIISAYFYRRHQLGELEDKIKVQLASFYGKYQGDFVADYLILQDIPLLQEKVGDGKGENRDAQAFFSAPIPWPAGMMLKENLLKWGGRSWKMSDQIDYSRIDFSWMEKLSAYDHWNWSKTLEAQDFYLWGKLRLMKGEGSLPVRHLAVLLASTFEKVPLAFGVLLEKGLYHLERPALSYIYEGSTQSVERFLASDAFLHPLMPLPLIRQLFSPSMAIAGQCILLKSFLGRYPRYRPLLGKKYHSAFEAWDEAINRLKKPCRLPIEEVAEWEGPSVPQKQQRINKLVDEVLELRNGDHQAVKELLRQVLKRDNVWLGLESLAYSIPDSLKAYKDVRPNRYHDDCMRGNGEACLSLASSSLKQRYWRQAEYWGEEACKKKSSSGCLLSLQAKTHAPALNASARPPDPHPLLERACALADGLACSLLAAVLEKEDKRNEALIFYEKACQHKFIPGCLIRAKLAEKFETAQKSRTYYQMACKLGAAIGCEATP